MAQRFFTLICVIMAGFISPSLHAELFTKNSNPPFVTAERAFHFDFSQKDRQLILSWHIKPGYYLYRNQITIEPYSAQFSLFTLPSGKTHQDEFYGKTEIYTDDITLRLTLLRAKERATVRVTWQGCATAGLCYPPETRLIPLSKVAAHIFPAAGENSAIIDQAEDPSAPPDSLAFSPLWAFLAGIGIALTPCVLPMYPLISIIISGSKRPLPFTRLLVLALTYVQGMALTYTLMGSLVAAGGLKFQAALQHPAVLISLSLLFVLLALSMFGFFSLQLPSALQTRLSQWSSKQKGGSLPGVFLMGIFAGLICSPCTTAPLSAILLYTAQSGNILAGAGTLYLYSMGIGLPLIAATLSGNRFLPKSGPWMQVVKKGLGFVILTLPIMLLERVTGVHSGRLMWSLLGTTFFCWAFISSQHALTRWIQLFSLVFLLGAMVCVRPLQDFFFTKQYDDSHSSALHFTSISTAADLQMALHHNQGKISILDLYADWCVACKAFEKETFIQPQVQNALRRFSLLKADVTKINSINTALLKHLQVLGLPTILFFDKDGNEIINSRINGFMDATAFHKQLEKLAHSTVDN